MELEALAYSIARKIFSQKTRDRLKLVQYDLLAKLAPVKRAIYGTYDNNQLLEELNEKLPQDFEVLMVHSSHAGMMPMYTGQLKQLLDILIKLCENGKTLVMPAFFFGTNSYHFDVIKYFGENTELDLYRTPSQMGLLTELFRNHPQVKISHHPTHRIIALGPKAEELTVNHELCRFSCGSGSPFEKMATMRTLIIGLGIKYFRCMTQMHSPEYILLERNQHPHQYQLPTVDLTMIDSDNHKIAYTLTVARPVGKRKRPSIKAQVKEWQFHGSEIFYAWAHDVQERLFQGYAELSKN